MISGAAGGIGRATAKRLSELGASLVLTDIKEEKLQEVIKSLDGQENTAYAINFKDIESVETAMDTICKENGVMNGFVHCAGIAPMRPFKMTKYEDVLSTMQINFFSFVEIVHSISQKRFLMEAAS